MTQTRTTRNAVVAGLAAAGLAQGLWSPPPARACGGFFCSIDAPVEQSAEEIVFVHDAGQDTVTAVIRIMYQGPSEKFAWVLPIAGVPEVSVSSNAAFDSLRNATDPQYSVAQTIEGECKDGGFGNFPGGGVTSGPGASPRDPSSEADSGIGVLAHEEVGPYVYDVISVDPELQDPAQAAVDWLTENEYDVTGIGPDVLGPYLADGLNLLAFKLQKSPDLTAGSIRPVILTYEGDKPSIPIRPTAVAARPDMGIRVWVVGAEQAIPLNYKALVINEALIDWFNWRSTYDAVVTAAADEAGGQGFVTEMAGPSSQLDQIVWPSWMEQQWLQYSRNTFVDGFDAISQASGNFRGYDGWREAVCGAVTLPVDVTCDTFGRDPETYRGVVQIDATTFMRLLYEGAIKPLIETQKLLTSRAYFTRLYSTMSADEMDTDPVFDWNADLSDVPNVHTAQQIIECQKDLDFCSAPWRIELPQGGVLKGQGCNNQWPLGLDSNLPANLLVVSVGTSGSGDVLEDNTEEVLAALFAQSGMESTGMATPDPPDEGMPLGGEASPLAPPNTMEPGGGGSTTEEPTGDDAQASSGDGGCSVVVGARETRFGAGLLGLAGFVGAGLLLARRRRRG